MTGHSRFFGYRQFPGFVYKAVAKIYNFWWATGQSNLVYKRLATTKASKVWFSYSHNCTLTNGAVFHAVCQVWLSWVARQNCSLLAAAYDCELVYITVKDTYKFEQSEIEFKAQCYYYFSVTAFTTLLSVTTKLSFMCHATLYLSTRFNSTTGLRMEIFDLLKTPYLSC